MPQEKASFVEALQKIGKNRVAMVGDGINDAPALVQSDIAIAVHSGGHLGKEAADITLNHNFYELGFSLIEKTRRQCPHHTGP